MNIIAVISEKVNNDFLSSCIEESENWIIELPEEKVNTTVGKVISFLGYEQFELRKKGICPFCLKLKSECFEFCVPQGSGFRSFNLYNTIGEKKKTEVLKRISSNSEGKIFPALQIKYISEREDEVVRFNRPIIFGLRPPQFENSVKTVSKEVSESVRQASSSRRRNKIKRTINANLKRRKNSIGFMTVTFKPLFSIFTGLNKPQNVNSLPDFLQVYHFSLFGFCPVNFIENSFAINELNKFEKRLRYYGVSKGSPNFTRYICIKEYQGNGRPHYHLVFFDWKYLDQSILSSIWKKNNIYAGSLDVTKVHHVKRLANYISSYLGKGETYVKGDRLWWCSRNCIKIVKEISASWMQFSGKVYNWYFSRQRSGNRITFFYKYNIWKGEGSSFPGDYFQDLKDEGFKLVLME